MIYRSHSFRRSWLTAARLLALAVSVLVCVGCRKNGPPLAEVSGTVTLDGQPLADADVTFQPEGSGAPSIGTTNAEGDYELTFLNDITGATVGPNKVMITTARSGSDDGSSPAVPEKLPARYHSQSETRVEVTDGDNTFNFDLQSQ